MNELKAGSIVQHKTTPKLEMTVAYKDDYGKWICTFWNHGKHSFDSYAFSTEELIVIQK